MRLGMNAAWAISLIAGSIASAGPLVPSRVLPDATWVVHVDVEGAVGSNLGRALLESRPGMEFRAELRNEVVQEIGIDPLHDIRGVTIFGVDEDEQQAVILLSATNAIDRPLEQLPRMVRDYQEIREGPRVVHSWAEDHGRMYAYAAPGVAEGERIVLLSGDVQRLQRGILRVERGGDDSAAPLQQAQPQPGSYLFVSASQIPGIIADDPGASTIVRFARAVVFDAGGAGDAFSCKARITTAGAQDATTMLQAAQGLLAVARMAASSEPEIQQLLPLADAIRMHTEGETVAMQMEIPHGALMQALRALEDADHEPAEGDAARSDDEAIRRTLKEAERDASKKPAAD